MTHPHDSPFRISSPSCSMESAHPSPAARSLLPAIFAILSGPFPERSLDFRWFYCYLAPGFRTNIKWCWPIDQSWIQPNVGHSHRMPSLKLVPRVGVFDSNKLLFVQETCLRKKFPDLISGKIYKLKSSQVWDVPFNHVYKKRRLGTIGVFVPLRKDVHPRYFLRGNSVINSCNGPCFQCFHTLKLPELI